MLSGDVTFVLGASGHIAGVINPPAKKKRNYWTNDTASRGPGRLVRRRRVGARQLVAGLVPLARPALRAEGERRASGSGNAEFTPIEDAPGAYVKQKAP